MRYRLVVIVLAALTGLAPAFVSEAVAAPQNPTVIHVDDGAAAGGNGSGERPYNNLPDAVAAARASSTQVVIKVEPGDYPLSSPLVLDFPVELRGSNEAVVAPDDPWPTGSIVAGTETRVFATAAIGSQPLIKIGRSDATVLTGVSISGFTFQGSSAAQEIVLTRVQRYLVADNVFRAPANFAFQSNASSGELKANYFSGVGTAAIFNGGYPESPSNIVASGNRAVGNNLGGILLNGASIDIPELGDHLQAVVRDNDLSNNTGNQGFGLRLFILRRDMGAPGDTQSEAHIDAVIRDNRLVGNRIGVIVDAGFPYRSVAGVCDPRTYSGTINLDLFGNTLNSSQVSPALITFTRFNAALNPSLLPLWQYLHGATFEISDNDGTLASARIDHPATDPFVGPCPGDETHEPLDNTLIYNGVTLPNGRNF